MQLKKPSDTEREGESARSKVQIHPQFHLSGEIHIHTDQNSVFQTNKHTKKENPKGNGKKKEEKPLIARFSAGSQFLIFFFSSVSLHHNMA